MFNVICNGVNDNTVLMTDFDYNQLKHTKNVFVDFISGQNI